MALAIGAFRAWLCIALITGLICVPETWAMTSHRVSGTTYYVSSSGGQDENDGLTPQTAFSTIARVNDLNLEPGDSVLFKCGDTWRAEMLRITKSGAAGAPITFGAYPPHCSDKPILSGSQPIAGWASAGGNLYAADLSGGANEGRFPNGINQLFRNGQRLTLGRWPNLDAGNGGYSTVDGYAAPRDIVDYELPNENWAGAVIHLKAMRWYIVNRVVSSSGGSTLHLAADTSCWGGACTGWGYFINHHLKTLDREGEWYYDESARRVYVYTAGGVPADGELEGSVVLATDTRSWGGVLLGQDMGASVSNVVIENLEIRNWYMHGIATPTNYSADDGSGWVIRNNTIRDVDDTGVKLAVWVYSAQDGIDGWRGGRNVEVSHNIIDGANHFGIDAYSRESSFMGNSVQNIGLVENLGKSGLGCGYTGSNCTENGDGLRFKLDKVSRSAFGNTVRSNRLDKIAYNGMDVFGPNNVFEYNFISRACYTKGDCGGIRTFGRDDLGSTNVHDIVIRNNIIVDTVGNTDGAHDDYKSLFGMGLYIDNYSRNVEVSGNTVVNSTITGILYQNSTGQIKNNTLYNNASGGTSQAQVEIGPALSVISEFSGNVLYALKDSVRTMSLNTRSNLSASDGNHFFNPYQAKNIDVEGLKTLEEWQTYSGMDGASKKNWFTQEAGEPTRSEIFYNASSQPATINLGYKMYLDLDQNPVAGSIVLQPFEARVLIENGELSMPDLGLSVRLGAPLDLAPDAPVTLMLGIENVGTAPATGVTLTDSVPVQVISATWTASPALAGTTAQADSRYVWRLPDLAPGASGVITVSGVFSFTPQTFFAVINRASVGASEAEMNYANNSVTTILGGFRVYLPLALR